MQHAHTTVIAGPWPVAAAVATPPHRPERRKSTAGAAQAVDPAALRVGLTPAQLVTLEAMEIFRWRLAFVRRPMFQAPIPVLYDKDGTRYVVILEDGTLDEHPTLKVRG